MCCPLILCREEIMSGAKGLDTIKKRGRKKKECNSRRQDAHEQVKERGELSKANSKKKERTTRSIYSSSQGAPVIKVTS
jgi:hypothetical protein